MTPLDPLEIDDLDPTLRQAVQEIGGECITCGWHTVLAYPALPPPTPGPRTGVHQCIACHLLRHGGDHHLTHHVS